MKPLFIAILGLFLTTASAQPQWIPVAKSKDNTSWEVQAGSLEFKDTKGGTTVATVTGRVVDLRTSRIDLHKWYVSATDCANGMGKLVTLNISGEFLYDNDFVIGSGNIASELAEAICGAATQQVKQFLEKSL